MSNVNQRREALQTALVQAFESEFPETIALLPLAETALCKLDGMLFSFHAGGSCEYGWGRLIKAEMIEVGCDVQLAYAIALSKNNKFVKEVYCKTLA
jgi:hypothetical protein